MKITFFKSDGRTAFHFACQFGHSKIAEMLMNKSTELNIELNVKDKYKGITAFHSACIHGHSKVIIPSFARAIAVVKVFITHIPTILQVCAYAPGFYPGPITTTLVMG